ncbi:hypothetical protein KO525_03700 [Psychrosphaera sp. B3R10]|uniref:hypothetical protein n=1 Tax=unclassified Psychrosphaera TaxID=2641570 RepID=UPI001C083A87|nr:MULTISPECIES: hypothetical protein [unclassified Psychrosphaera]MBU2881382.1 hypothetical protein [Psychrosphaera sp. I2R16]MBU2988481.1 hypothetical protein [Psychrosphaera sp. B3R10]
MKYLLIVVICAGAYYFYSNKASIQPSTNDLEYTELIKHLKTNNVKTSVLLSSAYKFAVDGCNDNEWLKIKGSNTQACNDRLNSFKDICAERIFPDMDIIVDGYDTANKMLKRYSECTGV